MCREHGGVGILNLRDLNMSLLGSWISRYQKDDGKLWKQIIDEKYKTTKPNFLYTPTEGGSHFLKGVMWATKAVNLGIR
jgi:rhamnogalacturonyl hydrolase YesR